MTKKVKSSNPMRIKVETGDKFIDTVEDICFRIRTNAFSDDIKSAAAKALRACYEDGMRYRQPLQAIWREVRRLEETHTIATDERTVALHQAASRILEYYLDHVFREKIKTTRTLRCVLRVNVDVVVDEASCYDSEGDPLDFSCAEIELDDIHLSIDTDCEEEIVVEGCSGYVEEVVSDLE